MLGPCYLDLSKFSSKNCLSVELVAWRNFFAVKSNRTLRTRSRKTGSCKKLIFYLKKAQKTMLRKIPKAHLEPEIYLFEGALYFNWEYAEWRLTLRRSGMKFDIYWEYAEFVMCFLSISTMRIQLICRKKLYINWEYAEWELIPRKLYEVEKIHKMFLKE